MRLFYYSDLFLPKLTLDEVETLGATIGGFSQDSPVFLLGNCCDLAHLNLLHIFLYHLNGNVFLTPSFLEHKNATGRTDIFRFKRLSSEHRKFKFIGIPSLLTLENKILLIGESGIENRHLIKPEMLDINPSFVARTASRYKDFSYKLTTMSKYLSGIDKKLDLILTSFPHRTHLLNIVGQYQKEYNNSRISPVLKNNYETFRFNSFIDV